MKLRLPSARRVALTALVAAAMFVTSPSGQARREALLVRVEQDWVLVVSSPDARKCSPQLFFQLYPESGGEFCCQLLVNYMDQPTFSAGGVQIQEWRNNTVLDGQDNNPNQAVLTAENETVTFTLVMEVKGAKLTFSAVNVSSTSWGDVSELSVAANYDPLAFETYSTEDTVAKSGILLGSNRVTSLTLAQVRKTDRSGNVTIELPRVVFP